MGALDGLTILVPEARDIDLFATMLEAEGATALRCPLVGIRDVEDASDARAWIDKLIAGAFDDVVLLTGEGLRRLLSLSGDRRAAFVAALGRVRTITRGPKPVRALHEIGLVPGLAARTPTSQGVLDALTGEDLRGRRIGAQLYPGDGATPLLMELHARGADVSPVTPYRYVGEAETAQVAEAVRALVAGNIGMIAFTSSPQIERLAQVAREAGLEKEFVETLSRLPVAAIGPVVEDALKTQGAKTVIRPEANFHLKPLVRAIVDFVRTGHRP